MKIAYVIESLEPSGGVKVIVGHAEGLASRGHDVSIVTRDARHDWLPIRVPIVAVPHFDRETLPEADVHVATWFPTVVPVVNARRAPRIFHFSQGYEALYPNVAHRLSEIAEAYRQPVPKILISEHLRGVLVVERYPGPYFVVPQSVPVDEFRPAGTRTGPRRPPVVGIVGPFEMSLKGVSVALRAVRRLRETGREILLHRASLVPLSAEEDALAPSQRYDLCVAAARMPAWYHELDLLLFASEPGEGFGLPPLEAMAAGIPAVVTDIPSLRILPPGAVVRVEVGDDAALAREAARLLDDDALWSAHRKRGLEAASRFTLGPVLDRLEQIFAQKIS